MVFKVVGVTRSQELLYAHGSQDDFFFDKDLQWHHVALKARSVVYIMSILDFLQFRVCL